MFISLANIYPRTAVSCFLDPFSFLQCLQVSIRVSEQTQPSMFVQILRVLLRAHDFLRESMHSLFSWPDSIEGLMVQVEKNGLLHCDISSDFNVKHIGRLLSVSQIMTLLALF